LTRPTTSIPWADKLTFRTDQTRYRRDHAKYLSLIAALTLLHQYQRQETTRMRDGVSERCVVATLEDLELANELASATLAPRLDALLPQTRQLLDQLRAYVTERAAQEQVPCHELRFSQRQLRAALGWQDRTLRRQLARLVELEYLVVYRTGCGNQKVYQWWSSDAVDTADSAALLGLTDVARLSRRTTLSQGLLVPQSGDSAPNQVESAPNRHRIGTGNGANRHRAKSTSSRDL
jgi:DNA primase